MFNTQKLSYLHQQTILIHYKNCIFHGQVIDSLKQNVGIVIMDNGQVIISNFKNDQLNGQCIIFLDYQTYVIGNFIRGIMDGYFLLRNSKVTIYCGIKLNKISGDIVVLNWDQLRARLWVIQDGQGHCTKQLQINPIQTQQQILSTISPYTQYIPSSVEYIYQKFSKHLKIQTSKISQTTQISIPTMTFHKLKLYLFKDKLIQYGIYHQDLLNDLGFKIQGGTLQQGKFKNGNLHGQGLKKQINSQKILYGMFKNGDIRSVDIVTENYQLAKQELKKYKKQIHIHSLEYVNNYFNERPILLLQNLLKTIEINQQTFTNEMYYQNQRLNTWKNKSYRQDKQGEKQLKNFYKTSSEQRQKQIFSSNFVSRFKSPQNNNLSQRAQNSDNKFSQGIRQFQLINKALRKFK